MSFGALRQIPADRCSKLPACFNSFNCIQWSYSHKAIVPMKHKFLKDAIPDKNSLLFASLTPDDVKVCTGRDLAEALGRTELSTEEARTWHCDLWTARKALRAAANRCR